MGNFTPSLYNSQDVFSAFYPARIDAFAAEGARANYKPAARDGKKNALIIVDGQWDFCATPDMGATLSVPGSLDDMGRLISFIYRNAENLNTIYPSYDTHKLIMIFFKKWWAYQDNLKEHPGDYTMIGLNPRGEAVDLNQNRRVVPLYDIDWSLKKYLPMLKVAGSHNYDLTIWPYHTIEGTQGHNLVPALAEALAFFSAARNSQIQTLVKGTIPQVEHYGIFGPEVEYPGQYGGGLATDILTAVSRFDLVYVAGEAKSHCVLSSMRQLVEQFKTQPNVLKKIRFLTDCTSSVQVPGVDFDGLANAELTEMARLGVQLVKSTDPVK